MDQIALAYDGYRCAVLLVAPPSKRPRAEEPEPGPAAQAAQAANVTGSYRWKSSSHVHTLLLLLCLRCQQSLAMASLRRLFVLTGHFRPPKSTTSSASSTFSTSAVASPTLPLAGIRVLDMTRVLAGVRCHSADSIFHADAQQPYCTQLLGDLG